MALAVKMDPEDRGERFAQVQAVQAQADQRSALKPARLSSVASLPRHPRLPRWLVILGRCQQGSTVLAGSLVAATLVVYSWTAYVDQMVSRSLRKLDALQAQTQQLTAANETLKQNMAEQATAPGSGLRPYEPNQAIFLSPAADSPAAPAAAPSPPAEQLPAPLGY